MFDPHRLLLIFRSQRACPLSVFIMCMRSSAPSRRYAVYAFIATSESSDQLILGGLPVAAHAHF